MQRRGETREGVSTWRGILLVYDRSNKSNYPHSVTYCAFSEVESAICDRRYYMYLIARPKLNLPLIEPYLYFTIADIKYPDSTVMR